MSIPQQTLSSVSDSLAEPDVVATAPLESNHTNLAENTTIVATEPRLSSHEITQTSIEENSERTNSSEYFSTHTAPEVRQNSGNPNFDRAATTTADQGTELLNSSAVSTTNVTSDLSEFNVGSSSNSIPTTNSTQNNITVISLDELKSKALSGDINILRELGERYYFGENTAVDYVQALVYFRLAAEQGDVDAQLNLAVMYELGHGTKRNYTVAADWFRKAALQGNSEAQFHLGLMHQFGRGVQKDDNQAASYFERSAKQGYANSQYELGRMYAHGKGVALDQEKAKEWFLKAANQDNEFAQFELGLVHLEGDFEKKDYDKAINWFTKAANQGLHEAQLVLVAIYSSGLDKNRNLNLATYWLLKSGLSIDGSLVDIRGFRSPNDSLSILVKLFPKALASNLEFENVKKLQFHMSGDNGINFSSIGFLISSNTSLECLHLSGSPINDANAQIIADSLENNTTLNNVVFEGGVNKTINIQIKSSLEKNKLITELREYMKLHSFNVYSSYPLEIIAIMIDKLIVSCVKGGQDKQSTLASIDEYLASVRFGS